MRDIDSAVADQCETLVTCNICKEKFYSLDDSGKPKIPKVLECLHSFCDVCLKEYIRSGGLMTSVFPCPTCRKSNLWPLKGVDAFPTDRKAKLILELMNILEESPTSSGDERPACEACSNHKVQRKSEFFCTKCTQMLCKQCCESHKNSAVLAHHKYIDLSSGAIIHHHTTNNTNSNTLCTQHQLMLAFTCTTCNQNLCHCCLFSHKNHQFVMTDSLMRSSSSNASSDDFDFQKLCEDLETARSRLEIVLVAEKELERELESSKEAVDRTYKEARAELEKQHGELLQQMKQKKSDLHELCHFKKKMVVKVKEAEKVLEKGVGGRSREKVEKQVRFVMEGLHEVVPSTKIMVFKPQLVLKMGEMIEEDFALNSMDTGASDMRNLVPQACSSSMNVLSASSSFNDNKSRMSREWNMKDAVIESLKINTIRRGGKEQSDRMIMTIKAADAHLWRLQMRCKSCCFMCKGQVLVLLDSSEREVGRQIKVLRSSDGFQVNVTFELGSELISRLIDCYTDKHNLYLLCSSTSQHTLLKKFKLDLSSKLHTSKEITVKCCETSNLDLLESHIIDPVGFAFRKNTLAILANKGTSLHLFSSKLKPIVKLTSSDIGRSNYVDLDDKANVYVADVGRGEIRVFDSSGQIKSNFSYMGNASLQMAPQGIRIDEKSCILLVDQALNTVSLYDTNNRLVDHVVENLNSPMALAYSSERHLIAVTNADSVQVYKI